MNKPNQTGYDPSWRDKYKNMIATPGQAVSHLRPGQRIFIGTGCGEPKELVKALTDRASKLADMEIIQLLTLGEAPYAHKELADNHQIDAGGIYSYGEYRFNENF